MYLLNMDDTYTLRHTGDIRTERRQVKKTRTTDIRPYLGDYTFFTLAPFYFYGGIACSIVDQFELEHGPRDRILVDYRRTIIEGLRRWGELVEGIANEAWDAFCRYVTSLGFYSLAKGVYWQTHSRVLGLESTDIEVVRPGDLPVRIQVFLPDGNKGRLCLKAGAPAQLWWDRPQPLIVEAATRILSQGGRI